MTILHQGMTWEEVIESIGRPIYDTWAFQNRFGQLIHVSGFAFFKTDKDRLAGRKTHYRLYFYEQNGDFKLVHWAEKKDWKCDEVILKKTRFK